MLDKIIFMYKHFILGFFIMSQSLLFSQLKGTVKDATNQPIPFVNIYVENTYLGTTTNNLGLFELSTEKIKVDAQIIFQAIGFKTQKIAFQTLKNQNPMTIILIEDQYQMTEVVISAKENPADRVIREAIKNRKLNAEKIKKFSADFYSKGLFKLKNMPKKILGQEIGDFEGKLDSTGTGIVYLSETFSKINFERPNKLQETIIASKVAGSDRGFSYNTARSSNFDFYENTVDFGIKTISPIADNAFIYYKFKLEATFYDVNNKLINKIQLIPRRDAEPVYEGYIYIVEDDWSIYATEFMLKGYRMQNEFTEFFEIKQNYSLNTVTNIWSKNQQQLYFKAGAFGITFEGRFNHVFNNYEFKENFEKNTFTKEVVKFSLDADKMTDDFWSKNRPLPLTIEESTDYIKKDSIKVLRESKTYLDSIDLIKNKPKIYDILMGYTYKNSFKNWKIRYNGLLQLVHFNTVQGWNIGTGLDFEKINKIENTYYTIRTDLNYGFSDKKFRPSFIYAQKFNNFNKAYLAVFSGIKAEQFNSNNPISPLINTTATLMFKDNYMKLYEKRYLGAYYRQEIVNGFYLSGRAEYSERLPLFNTTDYVTIKKDKAYTSNNPLDPTNNNTSAIDNHHLTTFTIRPSFRFNQKYISRPDGKLNYQDGDIPELNLAYTKGFAGSDKKYNFDYIEASSFFQTTFANKGSFGARLKAGYFFNAENISFVDYKHFNGNQTHVYSGINNFNQFHLLPYYAMSTNESFFEAHVEHNFNGYIMNKIPLLNKLKSELVIGYNHLTINNLPTYHEFSIGLNRLGFGKFKVFRIDYVKSFQGNQKGDGLMFGFMLFGM